MSNIKFYTEEQVRSAFRIGLRENYIDEQDAENFANKGIKYLKPIELPSDEEIEKEFTIIDTTYPHMIAGAKWMKEQILNQNK